MLVPLHAKSHYSLGYGVLPVPELVERATVAGLGALALTDLENLYGQVLFHHACRVHAVRPLTGAEMRPGFRPGKSHGSRAGRVVALVRNRTGYERLCAIVTERRAHPARPTPDPLPALAEESGGLLVLSDDLNTLRRAVRLGMDPADLRLLIVRSSDAIRSAGEGEVLASTQRLGIRAVADPDIVLGDAGDLALHRLQVAIHLGRTLDRLGTEEVESDGRSFADAGSWAALYEEVPDAIAETRRVADVCRFELGGRCVVPAFELPGGETPAARLERACRESLSRKRLRKEEQAPAYESRLERELQVVSQTGLAAYFLVIREIVEEARRRGIETAGRGSAAGSLVCHLLGITRVDPVALDLLFERFLHPGRREMPDVDLDVSAHRRDGLLGWVFRRFEDRVALASSHVPFRLRSAYREGLKALGAEPRLVERFSRLLPPEELPELATPSSALALLPPELRDRVPLVERLIGQPRHIATHPGGVVIADRPIREHLPLETAPKGLPVSQYDGESLLRLGLVKIDLLGNRCLSELEDTLRLLADRGAVDAPAALEDVALDDGPTLGLIDHAATLGCFQLESPAMRSVLARLPIQDLDDVTGALAIVRPGAAAGRAKEAYLRRARSGESVQAELPAALFAGTHGIPLYEEDLMRALHRVAGLELAEADELRAEIQRADERGLEGLLARTMRTAGSRGQDPEQVRAIWPLIAGFAAYSFSRAHAASYAHLGYLAAYMKAHHPVEFACALLRHHGGLYPLRAIAAEMVRRGVRIVPPSVNRSHERPTVERGRRRGSRGPVVRCGLDMIRGLGKRRRRELLRARQRAGPFRDLADLWRRTGPSGSELRALVLSGSCDGLPPLTADRYPFVHEEVLERMADGVAPEGLPFSGAEPEPELAGSLRERYRKLVRIRNELAYLGIFVSDHPMGVLRPDARRLGCLSSMELYRHAGREVRFAGIVSASRRILSEGGEAMRFLTFEDEEGLVEAILFPAQDRSFGPRLTTPGPFLVEGIVQAKAEDFHLRVSRLIPFHERNSTLSGPARSYGGSS